MSSRITAPQATDHIYNQITAMVDRSLSAVLKRASVTNGSLDLDTAISSSKTLLEGFREKVNENIRELREVTEWDTFTIAFYGETNAGKSTLIETLRILLKDEDKIATQEQFMRIMKELRLDSMHLTDLEEAIQSLESKLVKCKEEANVLELSFKKEKQNQSAQLQRFKSLIDQKKKGLSLWRKLLYFFKKLDEEKSWNAQNTRFAQWVNKCNIELESAAAKTLKISDELNMRRKEWAILESKLAQVKPLQDGYIIGNGRSDFTVRSHTYRFTVNGQKFQLIDVPGIEGDEKQVMKSIETSVKTAHAVFYVTRAAAPPGSGSEGQEGTIDKIKRQLGKQTEVWAIFNKSATHPQVLQSETLINQNDAVGLNDMDSALTGTLGLETYKGHVCISAMPAFLASASCLLPNNPHVKSREKFLMSMSAEDILQRSGMNSFLRLIRDEICQNFQRKINESNLKKIRSCLDDGIHYLKEAISKFDAAAQQLDNQQKSASLQIDDLLASTSKKLNSECRDQLAKKKNTIRKDIYEYIEGDRSNDDFKDKLTSSIEELKTSIGTDLEFRFAKVFDAFKQQAAEIITKNQKNVNEILHYTIDDPFSSMNLNFNANFKMDNGINMMGLISTLGGATALVWASFLSSNPVGWTTAAVLGAVGLVFSFYKAIRSFFSSEYKKEQQRKSADENLNNVFSKLAEMLDDNLESANIKITEALQETKKNLRVPYEQSINTKSALEGIADNMVMLRKKLYPKPATGTTKAVAEISAAA